MIFPKGRFQDLKDFGVDTALAVDVIWYGLSARGQSGMNPPLALVLQVRASLLRCPDGKELYTNTFSYKGEPLKFVEWAYGDAKPLVDEINRACDILARQVVDETLLGVPYAPYASPRRTRYVPGYEPKGDLFEPPDIHKLDEGSHPW